jgi:hypothetical protein
MAPIVQKYIYMGTYANSLISSACNNLYNKTERKLSIGELARRSELQTDYSWLRNSHIYKWKKKDKVNVTSRFPFVLHNSVKDSPIHSERTLVHKQPQNP